MKNISRKRRMFIMLCVGILILFALIIRVGWIQFINGEELQILAYEQQTLDRKINPKRGTLYDSNTIELAISSTVYTITVNPTNIKGSQNSSIFTEIKIKNEKYEVLAGNMPEKYNEIVLVVGENNTINDSILYALGIKNKNQLANDIEKVGKDAKVKASVMLSADVKEGETVER